MKKLSLLFLCLLFLTTYSCKTIKIQGKKIKSADICDNCDPGNYGKYMVMRKKTYDPQIDDNSSPKSIAYEILGHVFPEGYKGGNLKVSCSSNSAKSPFSINDVMDLGSTGTIGTTLFYNEKEILNIDISTTVSSDLASIKAANPTISITNLDSFKAKLSAAYSKFANKELTIEGKYYQFGLRDKVVEEIAKNIKYQVCRTIIYSKTNPKRLITAIGLVYFDIKFSTNSIDDISSSLQSDASSYGITFNVSAEFKRNISKSLNKVTDGYFQIVTWRNVSVSHLNVMSGV
jgi:hypothetical protein